MAQHGSVQGVMQVSVLGQFPAGLLDQILRRLAAHAEHQYAFEMEEDVFSRGHLSLLPSLLADCPGSDALCTDMQACMTLQLLYAKRICYE